MYTTLLYCALWWISLQYAAPYVTIVYLHNGGGSLLSIMPVFILVNNVYSNYALNKIVLNIKHGLYIILSLGLSWSMITFDAARWWTFSDPAENWLAISLITTFLWLHWPKQLTVLKPTLILHYIISSSYILNLRALRPTTIIHTATTWNVSPYFYAGLLTVSNLPAKTQSNFTQQVYKQYINRTPLIFSVFIFLFILWFSIRNTLWLQSPSPTIYGYILTTILITVKPQLYIINCLLCICPSINIETLLLIIMCSYGLTPYNFHYLSLLFIITLISTNSAIELYVHINTTFWTYSILSALNYLSLMLPTCEVTTN